MNNRQWRFSLQRKICAEVKNNSFDDGKKMLDERGKGREGDAGCGMLDTGRWILVIASEAKQLDGQHEKAGKVPAY